MALAVCEGSCYSGSARTRVINQYVIYIIQYILYLYTIYIIWQRAGTNPREKTPVGDGWSVQVVYPWQVIIWNVPTDRSNTRSDSGIGVNNDVMDGVKKPNRYEVTWTIRCQAKSNQRFKKLEFRDIQSFDSLLDRNKKLHCCNMESFKLRYWFKRTRQTCQIKSEYLKMIEKKKRKKTLHKV